MLANTETSLLTDNPSTATKSNSASVNQAQQHQQHQQHHQQSHQQSSSVTSPQSQFTQQEKPLKMNTYIQLEIDQSNFNCLPRVCKFFVSKLNLNEISGNFNNTLAHAQNTNQNITSSMSLILAVKMQGNKRSFRTIEIPMHRTPTTSISGATQLLTETKNSKILSTFSSADLNLSYHITYPHFIKKDTNILYFYIQRKKKYKTKTILGYKTLAYTFVDLSTVLQRPFSDSLPLFFRTNTKTSSKSSLTRANVIGSLTLVGLVSQPVDLSLDLEYLTSTGSHCINNTSDYSDNEIHFEIGKRKKSLIKKARSNTTSNQAANNMSGNGGDIGNGVGASGTLSGGPGVGLFSSSSSKATPNSSSKTRSNSKKFTGKIIQFIRKLKNDNMTLATASLNNLNGEQLMLPIASSATAAVDDDEDDEDDENDDEEDDVAEDDDAEENENENEEDEEEDENEEAISDLDEFYNIEQISDYNSDSDDPGSKAYEPDTYSIVSTPKPKIQPFFTNSNAYFNYNGSHYNSTDLLRTSKTQSATTIATTTTNKQSEENTRSKQHFCVFYSDESDPLAVKLIRLLAEEPLFTAKFIAISSLAELTKIIFGNDSLSTINDLTQQSDSIKLLLFINEPQSLLNYIQNFLEANNSGVSNSRRCFKQYVVMRRHVSCMGSQLAKSSTLYQSLFTDEWWSRLEWSSNDLNGCIKELANRLVKYVSADSTRELTCQVGELMINQMIGDDLSSKFIPFLSEVRIGFASDGSQIVEEVFNSNTPTHSNRLSISSSNSTPQFSSLSSANNQSSSSTPLAFTLNLQSPNAQSSSHTSQQSSSTQTTSSQNPVKPANNSSNNNQTPKATQQQQATNSLQIQPAVLFSAASMSPPNSPKTTIGPNVFDEVVYNLQLDYWTIIFSNLISSLENSTQPQQCVNQQMIQSNSSSQKITLKAWFKNLNVFRTQLIMPNTTGLASDFAQSLTLVYQIKEKKQKIMRLSKKPKDSENKKEVVEGLTRLVCTSKNHSTPLKVFADDFEYDNIKFLQISSLWRGKVTFLSFEIPD